MAFLISFVNLKVENDIRIIKNGIVGGVTFLPALIIASILASLLGKVCGKITDQNPEEAEEDKEVNKEGNYAKPDKKR